jgi:hypothetical protein
MPKLLSDKNREADLGLMRRALRRPLPSQGKRELHEIPRPAWHVVRTLVLRRDRLAHERRSRATDRAVNLVIRGYDTQTTNAAARTAARAAVRVHSRPEGLPEARIVNLHSSGTFARIWRSLRMFWIKL